QCDVVVHRVGVILGMHENVRHAYFLFGSLEHHQVTLAGPNVEPPSDAVRCIATTQQLWGQNWLHAPGSATVDVTCSDHKLGRDDGAPAEGVVVAVENGDHPWPASLLRLTPA